MPLGIAVATIITLGIAVPATAAPPPDAGDSGLSGAGLTMPVSTPPQPADLRTMEDSSPTDRAENAALQQASAKARSTGEPVVATALTTETEQVTALPGGGFEYSGNPTPVRTRQRGRWTAVDTRLRRNADGTYSPAATAYGNVKFSGGGKAPLATTTSGATSYSVTWPGSLPAPNVSGTTATYREVLPGVDLVVSATTSGGFHEVLVVKTARAAAGKALADVTLGATTSHGTRPRHSGAGFITASPSTGMVLETSTPLMWDSNRTVPGSPAEQAAAAEAVKTHRGGPDRSDATHAGAAARVALIQVQTGPKSLRLVPDQKLLRSKNTVYPLYIDPTPNWHPASGGTPAFDEVKQGSPCNGASYYNNTGSAGNYGNLGVGYNGFSTCVGAEHAYYQWTIPAAVKTSNVTISSATVNATETYSSYCDSSNTATVNLHWTGNIGSGTNWNNRPAYNSGFSTSQSYVAAENPDNCPTKDTVTHGFDVKAAFSKARTGSKFTVVLSQDANESSKNRNAFKRFSDNPSLQVFFNRTPATPGAAQLAAVSGTNNVGCDTASPYPYMGKSIATNTPVLSVKITDPDSDSLRATFKYWVDGSAATYTLLSNDNLASGTTAKVNLPATFISGLTDGQIVDWQVSVTDGMATTAYPTWACHFVAQPHATMDPSIDPNTDYPDTDNGGGTGAPAGTTSSFILHNTGTTATKFAFNLDVPPALVNTPASQIATATDNTATVPVTPLAPGPHTLWVAALDAAGDASATEGYSFMAAGHANVTCASLTACFNNTAISADTAMTQGAADGVNSYSATDLTNAGWASGGKVNVNGAVFTLPTFGAGQTDNVIAANQTITYNYPVPTTGLTSLEFLTSATNVKEASPGAIANNTTAPYVPKGLGVAGTYCFDSVNPEAYCPALGTITYNDGTTQNFVLNVPDWVAGPNSLAAVVLPHRNTPTGQVSNRTTRIYPFSVPLTAGKTVASVTLPDVSDKAAAGVENLHIFGMAPRNTTTATVEANGTPVTPAAGKTWTGAWASPTEFSYNYLTPAGTNFSNMTFRTAVKPSISGDTVRIRLDNALGTSALTIGHATIALDGAAPPVATPTGAFTNLTFGGAASTKIPVGGLVYSDPLPYTVTADKWLLVSFSLTNSVASLPEHSWASDTDHIYTSAPGSGDHTADTAATAFTGTGTHNGNFTNLLTNIDVTTAGIPTQAVFGDGLIDAFQPNTAPNGQTGVRLSDNLLAAEPTTAGPFGTIAAGIQSNYVMTDNPQYYSGRYIGGPSALSRIDRDVLSQPGVNTVVLDEGLEDILNGQDADSLENDGYTQLLSYLQSNNINVIAIGLRPCDGYAGSGATTSTGASANDPCTTDVDTNRLSVNNWLSSASPANMNQWSVPSLFYIDADAAIGVPDTTNGETKLDPNAAIAADHVNLTDAGYAALTSAYLGPQDTWALSDADVDPAAAMAADTAPGASNPYLVNNQRAGQNPATLTGGAAWATDTGRGTVLSLNGTDAGASTTGPVLTTSRSYTISAWAKLTNLTNTSTIAAQLGVNNAAFALQYNKTYNAWTFIAAGSDVLSPTTTPHVSATTAPTLNTWTHLVGAYNAATHTMSLYINGTLVGTTSNTTPWDGTGTFNLGHSGTTGYFPGAISNVQAWDYTLTPQQVTALYQQVH